MLLRELEAKFMKLSLAQQHDIACDFGLLKGKEVPDFQDIGPELFRRISSCGYINELAKKLETPKTPAKRKCKPSQVVRAPKCVQVRFQGGNTGEYSYLTYLKFKKNDLAVVATPRGTYEVVRVTGFDDRYWLRQPYHCKWIVAKFNTKAYERANGIPIRDLICATPNHPELARCTPANIEE